MLKPPTAKPKSENAFTPFQEAIKNFEQFYDKSFNFDYFIYDFFKSVNTAMV